MSVFLRLNNKRMITPDAALGKVIGGKTNMFKMNKCPVVFFSTNEFG